LFWSSHLHLILYARVAYLNFSVLWPQV
jgi:hypothetical protein